MDCELVWISDTDESNRLYKLGYIDSSDQFEYYSSTDDENITNFVKLTYVNIPTIMHVLEKRYIRDNIYTFNGDVIISINPFKRIDIYNGENSPEMPHVYSVCNKMYDKILSKNQSVLVSGESGSGKTENTKYMLSYLCKKYAQSTELSDKIINSNYVIELFGNAKTRRNDNSSRFGKFIKLFVNNKIICGASIEKYLLEKSRISITNKSEKTYHIFYLICKNREKLHKYGFNDVENYSILKNSDYRYNIDEFNDLDKLLEILEQFNFSIEEIDAIFYRLRLVLELLNYNCKNKIIDELGKIQVILDKLDIDLQELIDCLTTKVFITRSEKIVKPLDNNEIEVQIKSYAEDLYEALFSNIIEKISAKLGNPQGQYIGILDIFGFEVFEDNGFEQLCINYTNEVLQQIFNEYIFKSEQVEYEKENLNWKFIEYTKNDDLIKLFNNNISIFSIINEQSILGSGSDKTIYNTFDQTLPNKIFSIENLKRSKNIFTVEHFTGKVDYKVDSYIKKNRINSKNAKIKTNLQYFTNQLYNLKQELDKNDCYFVRCIKPNDKNIPDCFVQKKIYKQLLYSGVIEGIKIVLNGYPIKKDRIELLHEFRYFKYYNKKTILEYFSEMNYTKKEYQVGKTKVFLKANIYDEYYRINNNCKNSLVVVIQKYVRRLIYYKRYYYTLYKIILIQSVLRMGYYKKFVRNKRYHHRSIIINKYTRRYIVRKKYITHKSCKLIQSIVRGFLKRLKYIKLIKRRRQKLSTKIVLWYRKIRVNRRILCRNTVHRINIIINDTEKELRNNKEELRNNKEELHNNKEELRNNKEELIETRKILSKQQQEIEKLKEQLNKIESSNEFKNMLVPISRKKLRLVKDIKVNSPDNLCEADLYENDLCEAGLCEADLCKNNENIMIKDLDCCQIKDKIVNDFFNIPLSSDSDSDLSLTEENIRSIKELQMEELGGKMERLYTELHNSKQNMNTMQMEYRTLLRVYETERYKKTFWGAVGAFWK